MDGYKFDPNPGKTPWPVVASSLWLRLGFVAAAAVVVALTQLYKGEMGILAAFAWVMGGAWLAALSWRRAKALLDQLDEDASDAVAIEQSAPKTATHPTWDRREVRATAAAAQGRV